MIALFLLLSAQAAASAPAASPPSASPTASLPTQHRICRQAPGSVTFVCTLTQQQQSGYRLPRYGPAASGTQSNRGTGVKVGAQASNRGRAGRNQSMATVGIPF